MNLQQQVFHEVVVVVVEEGAVVVIANIFQKSVGGAKTQRSQLCVLTISEVGLLQKPPVHHQQRVESR